MIHEALRKLNQKINLSIDEMYYSVQDLIENENMHDKYNFLSSLHKKGEVPEELTGLIKYMKVRMKEVNYDQPILDIVGTGGDGFNTINISTGSALLAASCGVKVLKHGNRAVSSMTGSADVIDALGIKKFENQSLIKESLDECHFSFCYAPIFHQAMREFNNVRKKINHPTIFNLIGPLLNPGQPDYLMIGVSSPSMVYTLAQVILDLDVKHALVFHTMGLDELSCLGKVKMVSVENGRIKSCDFSPCKYGFKRCSIDDLRGKDSVTNSKMLLDALSGNKMFEGIANNLILNAGFAIHMYGLVENIEDALDLAKEKINNGSSIKHIKKIQELGNA